MTDHTEVYRIAMVLHLRHKLDYFKKAKWDDEWIETARNIVREEFERTYKVSTAAESSASDTEHNAGSNKKGNNIFDSLPAICAPKAAELRDELDRYLSTDPEYTADVLSWWTRPHSLHTMLVCPDANANMGL